MKYSQYNLICRDQNADKNILFNTLTGHSIHLVCCRLFSLFDLELLLPYCNPVISMVSGPVIPIEASTIYPFQKMGA